MTHSTSAVRPEITMLEVREIIADCLGFEVDEIQPSAKFFDELDGESLDMLELSFRFEKAFHVKAPFQVFNSKELWERDESGQLTSESRDLIQKSLPYLNIDELLATSGSFSARGLVTVELIYKMLHYSAQK